MDIDINEVFSFEHKKLADALSQLNQMSLTDLASLSARIPNHDKPVDAGNDSAKSIRESFINHIMNYLRERAEGSLSEARQLQDWQPPSR